MATHSSVLAWRIPGTEEPGRRLSMRSHRGRHDWSDLAAAAVCICQSQAPNSSQHLFLLVYLSLFSTYVYFCFANEFIYTIFLDSTCKWFYVIFVFLLLIYFTLYDNLQIYPRFCRWHYLVPFYGKVTVQCLYVPHLYPVFCWWTFRLLLFPGYCK